MENYNYNSQNELYHWGIKGQRWGVRRFQNADGSLTSEGAKRYGVDDDGSSKKSIKQRIAEKRAAKKAAKLKKKRVEAMKRGREEKKKQQEEAKKQEAEAQKAAEQRAKDFKDGKIYFKDMTDDELAVATSRLRAEKNYKDAVKDVHAGRRIASKMVNEMIVPGITAGGKDLISSLVKHYGSEWLGLNEKDYHTLLREREEEARWKKSILENDEWVKNHSDKNFLAKEKAKQEAEDAYTTLKRDKEMSDFRKKMSENEDYHLNREKDQAAKALDRKQKMAMNKEKIAASKKNEYNLKKQLKETKAQDKAAKKAAKEAEERKKAEEWAASIEWTSPATDTRRAKDYFDELSRNEEEFLKRFMK